MTDPDARSFRVALVADRYINPPRGGLDAIPILIEHEWGVIQLPADRYPRQVAALLLEQVAEQTEEFHRRAYELVIIGRHAGLDAALAAAGVPRLDRLEPATVGQLRAFLRDHRRPRSRSRPSSRPASRRARPRASQPPR